MASKPAQSEVVLNIEEALDLIDKTMERVKSLYEQYFLGIQKQPPTFIHNDLERKLRDLAQVQIRNTALRYRYATLQQKFGSYNSYWRRTLRQIENGTYVRSLAKIGRKAAQSGEEIPEEILAKMPKRMREAVRRDREVAIAQAARRKGKEVEAPVEELGDGDFYEEFAPQPAAARVDARGAHVVDAADADLDLDQFFAAVEEEEENEPTSSGPPPQPEPAHSMIATTPSAPAVQRAAVLGGMPRAQSPAVRSQTNPGVPAAPTPPAFRQATTQPGHPPTRAPSSADGMPGAPTPTGPQPALRPSQIPGAPTPTGPQPALRVPGAPTPTGPQPALRPSQVPGAPTPTGPQPALRPSAPASRQTGPIAAQRAPIDAQQPDDFDAQFDALQQPASRQTGPIAGPGVPASPTPPASRRSGAIPAQPDPSASRRSGAIPAQPDPSGQMPASRRSGAIPAQPDPSASMPASRQSGAIPAHTDAAPSGAARPSGDPRQSGPIPQLPMPGQPRPSGPIPVVPPQPALRPTPQPSQPLRIGVPPGQLPAIPKPGVSGPVPTISSTQSFAPSQGVKPNPIAPGSASATKPVGVETMQGPFAREPSVAVQPRRTKRDTDIDSLSETTPTSPAVVPAPTPPRPSQPAMRQAPSQPAMRPTPTPQRPQATPSRPAQPLGRTTPTGGNPAIKPGGRPPPGMSDADVDALYQKYVKAKEMVGEQTNAQTYGKLLNTINSQAPKIMEQYKAKGVDFSVVVKDNQVIIKAKPKP